MNTEISVHKQSVRDLLRGGKEYLFVIPEYQRPYNWSEDEIETLFDDLWNFSINKENENKTYFLGSIVSYRKEEQKEQEIIDGQQRITSLFLLLRAIYTKLTASEEKTKEENNFIKEIEPTIWITDKYTGEVNYEEILLRSEVINDDGNAILKNILKTGKVDENANDNYSKNYLKLLDLYEKHSKEEPMKIYNFIFTVLNQAIILPISAGDEDTALTIFSTLNDTGLPLSDSDIFKARIYSYISKNNKSKLSDFIDKWKELENGTASVEQNIQSLFYSYMFFLRAKDNDEATTTPGLRKYYLDKNSINQRLYKEDILDDLEDILNFWRVAINREQIDEMGWTNNYEILKILECLKAYPNEFWKYPVIIFYLKYKNSENFEEVFLKFLRRFCAFITITYLRTPTVNAVKGDILKINTKIINSNSPEFNKLEFDSEEFKNILKTPHIKIVRMLLLIIAYADEEQKKLMPNKWEIEHIFPQKWHDNYITGFSDEVIKEKIEHLGNKIPFEKKLNIEASNGYFGEKKKKYKESKISITKEMAKSSFQDWGLNNIEARDNEVAEILKSQFKDWIEKYDSIIDVGLGKNNIDEETRKMIETLKSKGYSIN